jgi:hypothetical protein
MARACGRSWHDSHTIAIGPRSALRAKGIAGRARCSQSAFSGELHQSLRRHKDRDLREPSTIRKDFKSARHTDKCNGPDLYCRLKLPTPVAVGGPSAPGSCFPPVIDSMEGRMSALSIRATGESRAGGAVGRHGPPNAARLGHPLQRARPRWARRPAA